MLVPMAMPRLKIPEKIDIDTEVASNGDLLITSAWSDTLNAVTAMPQASENFRTFRDLFGYQYIIPENAAFATAIGAGLCSLRKEPLP